MEVILMERIARLGAIGDVVKVKNGYARNFLIPMKKALRASETNKTVFEERRHVIEEQNNKLSDTIVYIDDPVSSLDSTHLFNIYSFNAPAVRPWIICFWNTTNSSKIGSAAMLALAIMFAQSTVCLP